MTIMTIDEQNVHLLNVSRTFALTIPLLPEILRDWVGNTYLLCRIVDTIEDDPKLNKELKIKYLNEFPLLLKEFNPDLMSGFKRSLSELITNSAKPTELSLVNELDSVIERYYSFDEPVRNIIKRCLEVMCSGMKQIDRWSKISTLDELDAYCYFVAGVVGELLLRLFALYSPKINENYSKLLPLSVSFGAALQLTNIIKDIHDDKERGVSWLPFKATSGADFNTEYAEYINVAYGHCVQALEFIEIIPKKEGGIREFCLLADTLAIFTLRKIKKNFHNCNNSIKLSRKFVKVVFIFVKLFKKNNLLLSLLFKYVAKGYITPYYRSEFDLYKKVSTWDYK